MSGQNKQEDFISVLEKHKGIIYKIAHSYCHDPEDRKDLVQEIIFQLWRSFGRYNDAYRYSTWIYRIALNVAISFYRKESSRKKISGHLPDAFQLAEAPGNVLGKEEDLKILERFISGLNELDKALLLLYLEEKSYREMSEIMGLTETNVATKINRIKITLRQKFTDIKEY